MRLASALLLLLPAVGSGQTALKSTTVRAQELQSQKRFAEATDLLTMALRNCPAKAAATECRAPLRFHLGYLTQVQAEQFPDSTGLTRRSLAWYKEVLGELPGHKATLTNVAAVIGRASISDLSIEDVRSALAADSSHAATYLVLLGDRYLAMQDVEGARRNYRAAIARDPEMTGARFRLISAYDAEGAAVELFDLVRGWEERFPRVAAHAYEQVMARSWQARPQLADDALARWLELVTRDESFSAKDLEALPSGWTAKSVQDLRRFVEKPWTAPEPDHWWLSGMRREALAQLSIVLGLNMAAQGLPARAENCWNTALQFSSPESPQAITLAGELASLYYRIPELDPDGRKTDGLEERLYSGKAMAIGSGKLELSQRFHTVLGLMYAERKIWGGSAGWKSAIYQLEHALAAAARREQPENYYQPLPELKALLAAAYAKAGAPQRAQPLYLSAAKAYLDTDDLENAALMLDSARLIKGTATQIEALGHTRRILDFRTSLAATRLSDSTSLCTDAGIDRAVLPAKRGPVSVIDGVAVAEPREPFVNRQRFKMIADCSAWTAGRARLGNAAEAFAMVVDSRIGNVALIGAADLLRLERVQGILAEITGSTTEGEILDLAPLKNSRLRVVGLASAGDITPNYVVFDSDAVVSARVSRATLALGVPGSVSVSDGNVIISGTFNTSVARDLKTAISRIPGVRNAQVKVRN